MKIKDVAKRLNASPSFVYDLLSHELKHYRLGKGQGGVRVSEEHLQEYLDRKEKGGESRSPAPFVFTHGRRDSSGRREQPPS